MIKGQGTYTTKADECVLCSTHKSYSILYIDVDIDTHMYLCKYISICIYF